MKIKWPGVRLYKRKAGKGEFGRAKPATQVISFKVVHVLVDHLTKWLFPFLFCLFVFFFFTILQSATAIVFNLENDDYYTNKSEQSQKIHILN